MKDLPVESVTEVVEEKRARKERTVGVKSELNQDLAVSLPDGRWLILSPFGYVTIPQSDAKAPHFQDLLKAGHIALT